VHKTLKLSWSLS